MLRISAKCWSELKPSRRLRLPFLNFAVLSLDMFPAKPSSGFLISRHLVLYHWFTVQSLLALSCSVWSSSVAVYIFKVTASIGKLLSLYCLFNCFSTTKTYYLRIFYPSHLGLSCLYKSKCKARCVPKTAHCRLVTGRAQILDSSLSWLQSGPFPLLKSRFRSWQHSRPVEPEIGGRKDLCAPLGDTKQKSITLSSLVEHEK